MNENNSCQTSQSEEAGEVRLSGASGLSGEGLTPEHGWDTAADHTQVKEGVTGEKLVTNLLDWRKNQNEGRRGQKIRCKFSVNKKVRMFRVRLRSSFTLKEMEKKYSNNLTMETRRKFQNLIDKRKDEEIYFKIFGEIGSAPFTWIG